MGKLIEAKSRFEPGIDVLQLTASQVISEHSVEELRRLYRGAVDSADDGLGCAKGIGFILKLYFGIAIVIAPIIFLCSCAPSCPRGFFPEGGSCLSVTIKPM